MAKTIQVRVDDNLKETADELFSSLGLDTSTAIRTFLVASIEAGGIPFAIRKESWEEREMRILHSIERQKAGERFIPAEESLVNVRAAMERSREARRMADGA